MASYVAIIVGVGGDERFLKDTREVPDRDKAQSFRSDRAAIAAARRHIEAFPAVVARNMTYRVEPRA